MEVFTSGRRGGKTTWAIKEAAEKGLYIVCSDRKRAVDISRKATEMGLNILFPVTFHEFLTSKGGQFVKGYVVDDADLLLQELGRGHPVTGITYTL